MAGGRGKDLSKLQIGTDVIDHTKGDLSISVSIDEIDTRDDASAGYNEAIPGDKTITISGSINYQAEGVSAGQDALIAASIAGTATEFTWTYEEEIGVDEYTANGFVTSLESTNGDPQTMSFSIRISEAPVATPQA